MFRRATLHMKAMILFIWIVILVMSVILFPEISKEAALIAEAASRRISDWFTYVNFIFLTGFCSMAAVFFFVLYQTLILLSYIDRKKAFSALSVNVLRNIKYSAIIICALYFVTAMPIIYCFAELDDAPGVIIIGMLIGLFPFIIATFAAILQKLLQEAIDMKSENDLTI